jgi:MFS family permease
MRARAASQWLPVRLTRWTVDTKPLRESRDLRLIVAGEFVTGLGTQATLVALPYQLYVQTHSTFLTGLLGAFELLPLCTMSLLIGTLADRFDRRRLLLLAQFALVALSGALAAATLAGRPPIVMLYLLGGLLAGAGATENVLASAIVPNVVSPERMRSAIALSYSASQLTMVLGPALGGVLIATLGIGPAYLFDALSCLAMLAAASAMGPQPPSHHGGTQLSIRASLAQGLRFVAGNRALLGSFAIDLSAMTFGMPRALFPALSLTIYHSGAAGTGALLAAVAAGATLAALTTGWLEDAGRLGLIVIAAVFAWGGAIALAGVVGTLWAAALLLALAGAADSVSAVCRTVINQSVTSDAMRGRMSATYSLVVTSGPRFGDIESGAVAGLAGPQFAVLSGGLACIVAAGLIAAAFPTLRAYDVRRTTLAARPATQGA